MSLWLKQSTAVTVKVGPFVDDTDFKTAETALTISQADIRLSKNGGAFAQSNNAAGATHDANGVYGVPLDTTDTNTLGTLRVLVNETGALMVWQDFMVVPANVWDSLFGADKLEVDVTQFGGTNGTNNGGRPEVNTTHAAGTAWGSGAITAASIAADAITAAKIATGAIDADAIAADAVTEIQTGLATAAALTTVDDFLDTEVAAIKAVTDKLDTAVELDGAVYRFTTNALEQAPTGGGAADGSGFTAIPWNAAWDAEVQSEVADALAVYDPPTHAELVSEVDAVQTDIAALNDLDAAGIRTAVGLATNNLDTQLTAIDNFLDTEIADILTDTSTTLDDMVDDLEGRLTSALATVLQAHALAIGRVVVGVGSTTTAVVLSTVNGAAPSATDDFYNGRVLVFTSGALTLQAVEITDYVGATTTATVSAATSAPANAVTAVLV